MTASELIACKEPLFIGWREWLSLPDLDIPLIKAKIDTGAKTSAIHATEIEPFRYNHQDYVRFTVQPVQYNQTINISCQAALIDEREITDSGGHKESRYVIETSLVLGSYQFQTQISLTNRKDMRFRMLL